jgi:hypothetical protein
MHTKQTPLIFVYLGNRPPTYMQAALSLACRLSGVPVRLLAPRSFGTAVPDQCDHIPTELFYDPKRSVEFLRGLRPPTLEHMDLWVRSAERFAVLDAYSQWADLECYFHAELDCVTFDLGTLEEDLNRTGLVGLFVPMELPDRAIASLIYVNQRDTIPALLEWSDGRQFATEMNLIAQFGIAHPRLFHVLPSLEVLQNPNLFKSHGLGLVSPDVVTFLIDAASLGQWISGVDPIHLKPFQIHRSHFLNPNVRYPDRLQASTFAWENGTPTLIQANQIPFKIHAIHMHSKLHPLLTKPDAFMTLLRSASSPKAKTLPGAKILYIRSIPRWARSGLHRVAKFPRSM